MNTESMDLDKLSEEVFKSISASPDIPRFSPDMIAYRTIDDETRAKLYLLGSAKYLTLHFGERFTAESDALAFTYNNLVEIGQVALAHVGSTDLWNRAYQELTSTN